ncbi:glycosyltransferase 87 family protein [Actinoallomurus sp. NPDC052308]|uniref:glycosyltransferase 87 family protein n=1 Tax=Actinoallomurus sp. NPDC052308 TaxID=3155530 RepID=UPI00341A14FC
MTRSSAGFPVAGVLAFGAAVAAYATIVSAHPHDLWLMSDLRVYRWGGLLARHSDRLYDARIDGFAFTYAPIAAVIFAGLSVLPMAALRWLMTLAGLVSLVASVWFAWRTLGHRRGPVALGAVLLVAAAALWTEPVQKTLWFGQVNLILMALVLADLRQGDGRRWKGVGIGLATGVKFTPGIFIAYLVLTRRYRAAAVATATCLLTVAVGFAVLPHESWEFWGRRLFMAPDRVGPVDWVGNQSLDGALVRCLGGEQVARPYWLIASLVVGVCGLALAAGESRRGRELNGIVTCALTGLLVSPISWSHHWVWIVPALALVAHRMVGPLRRTWPWIVGGVVLEALFGAWFHAVSGLPALPQGLIRTVPFGAHREDRWHGTQLVIGNLYVLVASVVLVALLVLAVRRRSAAVRVPVA